MLFADLAGFTTFSETRAPTEVIGDAQRVLGGRGPGHRRGGWRHRALRRRRRHGGLQRRRATSPTTPGAPPGPRSPSSTPARPLAAAHPGWPIFRVGVNTGRAVVGNVGAAGRRSFAVIGDTTNVAARLMAAGEPGQVVVGRDDMGGARYRGAEGVALGPTRVKGKRLPVEAWILRAVGQACAVGVPCRRHDTTPRSASAGRLGRHDLQQERLIGPFQHQRQGKGRDRRVPLPQPGLRAPRRPA